MNALSVKAAFRALALLAAALAVMSIWAARADHPDPAFHPALFTAEVRFAPTGSMNLARNRHRATTLADGRVLITGGGDNTQNGPQRGNVLPAEVYDPATGTFQRVGSLTEGRALHEAQLLLDGRVLLVGHSQTVVGTAELFDPATGTFRSTRSAPFRGPLVRLSDGRVLLTPGTGPSGQSEPSQLFDPASETWSPTAPVDGSGYKLALLPDGRVLIAGGRNVELLDEDGDGMRDDGFRVSPLNPARIYDPATAQVTETGAMVAPRTGHTATLLADGRVLIAGGSRAGYDISVDADIPTEIYDPANGVFTALPSVGARRYEHHAFRLPGGEVLVLYGEEALGGLPRPEVFDPRTGAWYAAGSGGRHLLLPALAQLPDGRVLVSGGYNRSVGAWEAIAEIAQWERPVRSLLPLIPQQGGI